MVTFLDALNVLYRALTVFLLALIVWNAVTLKDLKRQAMLAVALVPFLLRVLNIK